MTTTSEPKPLSSRPAKALLWLLLPFAAGEAALAQCGHGGAVTGLRDLSKPSGPPPQPGQPDPCAVKKPQQQPGQGGGQIPLPPLGGPLQALPNDPAGPTVQILWTDHGNQNIVGATPSVPAGVGIPVRAVCTAKDGSQTGFLWGAAASLTGGFEGAKTIHNASGDTNAGGGLRPIGLADPVTHVQHQEATIYGAFAGSHPLLRLLCQDAQGHKNTGDVRFAITGPVLKQDGVQPKPGQDPLVEVQADINPVSISRRAGDRTDGVYTPRIGPYGPIPPEITLVPGAIKITEPRLVGVVLKASERNLPSGSDLEWMQVISYTGLQSENKAGHVEQCTQQPGLDAEYPYSPTSEMVDSPSFELDSSRFVRQERHFYAQSYLMWRANEAATYVPIAVVKWQYEGAAIADRSPLLLDPYPSKKQDLTDPLGWAVEKGSTNSKVESVKPASILQDFPKWSQLVGPLKCGP